MITSIATSIGPNHKVVPFTFKSNDKEIKKQESMPLIKSLVEQGSKLEEKSGEKMMQSS